MTDKKSRMRKQFRQMLAEQDGPILIPGAYDPVSALLIAEIGFPAVYFGSYAASATLLGQPDVGIVTMPEIVGMTKAIADVVDIPVLADAEDGWSNAANIWRVVRAFEDAGAVAIHIEDHILGKHTGTLGQDEYARVTPRIASRETLVGKIRAAVAARTDPGFVIIGRTDLGWAGGTADEILDRLNACFAAGADLVFPAGIDLEMLREIRPKLQGPVMITEHRGQTRSDEQALGVDISIHTSLALTAAFTAVKAALIELRDGTGTLSWAEYLSRYMEFEQFLPYAAYEQRVARYVR
ncbi:isocitrate lyase/PEP mutase family protein [Nocardia arthritidis]|uniref:Isocitrate lyase/PEP mutase family protein n=1 Tax=Nocardia arthritidis TaxID=228602 RepID=A0A6G9YRG2_9NOCA|nr:isocitrate lyase/phosphoenolpyruvate mutase family protein [Nocardia arthritidis]QIS15802.1 hypothetical protein F5544_39920 [Nocardia arthritidis]